MQLLPPFVEVVQYLAFPEASPGVANAIMPAVVAIKVAANINLRIRASYTTLGTIAVWSRTLVGASETISTGAINRGSHSPIAN